MELALLFCHVHEVIGPVEIVLASQREISIVELHAVQEKRMHLILHFDIQVTVVPGGDPNIEPCGVIFGHKHVDGLLEFVFEVDNFMAGVELEHAVEYIADRILVVHQHTKGRGVAGQQEFFAILIHNDVRLIRVLRHFIVLSAKIWAGKRQGNSPINYKNGDTPYF